MLHRLDLTGYGNISSTLYSPNVNIFISLKQTQHQSDHQHCLTSVKIFFLRMTDYLPGRVTDSNFSGAGPGLLLWLVVLISSLDTDQDPDSWLQCPGLGPAWCATQSPARVESIKPFLRSDQNTVWRRYFIQTGQVTGVKICHITYYAMSYHCQISLIKLQWWKGPDKRISWQHIVTLWRRNVDKFIFYCENFLEFILFTWLSDNLLLRAINKLINSQQYPVTRFLYTALLTLVFGTFDQNDLILQFLSVTQFSYFTFAKVC